MKRRRVTSSARPGRRGALRRVLRGVGWAVVLAVVAPAIFIGVNCYRPGASPTEVVARAPADIPRYARSEAFTYLTLPEWFIVYSTDEYARFVAHDSPTDFPYLGSIAQYWGYYASVCKATRNDYPFETGYHVMLGVIGTSFTAEYLVKAAYENTIGRVSGWFGTDTAEDRFAAETAALYGRFMHRVPWYRFNFLVWMQRLWSHVPLSGPHPVRKTERRFAFTLEYGIKSVYGWLIGKASESAYDAEALKTHARVSLWSDAPRPRAEFESIRGDGASTIVSVPRYEAFTENALKLLDERVSFSDVAGNDDMLVTAIVPSSFAVGSEHGQVIAERPILTEPQHRRLAVSVKVNQLHKVVQALRASGATIEHLYDY